MLDRPLTIASYQGCREVAEAAGGRLDTLARMADVAREAAGLGARLAVFPELYLTGYNIGRAALHTAAEPVDGPAGRRAAAIAAEHRIGLVYGYPERGEDGRVYNAAQFVGPDGTVLANHRKAHLFGDLDRGTYAPGPGTPALAELDGARIGLAICYDVEFPEFVRSLALAGADVVVVPTALMHPYEFVARTLVPARAYENGCFLAYVNRCASEGECDYVGLSCVVGPDGGDLARASAQDDELIVATLEPDLLAEWRRINTFECDRRPEIYTSLVSTGALRSGDDRA
ncbi:MAG: carbon-nitrogen hydrolase family protein [Gammaproteobacteria bacterium]